MGLTGELTYLMILLKGEKSKSFSSFILLVEELLSISPLLEI